MRKNFYIEDSCCALCEEEPNEYLNHLFFSYDFSKNVWLNLNMEWNTDLNIDEMMIEAKNRTKLIGFEECIMAGCWSIWKHRNAIIFDNKTKDIAYCISCFKEHITIIIKKAKPSLKEGMQSWVDTL